MRTAQIDRCAGYHPRAQGAEILKHRLKVKEYKLHRPRWGNLRFSTRAHIDLARHELGITIFGMNFYVVIRRCGTQVVRRRQQKSHIGFAHEGRCDGVV
jgi:large subunit ribosomal protein L11e